MSSQFEDCKTEEDYENYLKTIIEEQDAIENIPMKCRYKIWRMTHWSDKSWDANITSVYADLILTKGQVSTNKKLHFQIIFTCLSFVGQ